MFQLHGKSSCLIVAAAMLAFRTPTAVAAPTTINGSGFTTGINAGFGNAVGSNSKLTVTANTIGDVKWVLNTGGGNLDNANAVVIYIDTDNGQTGYAATKDFTDIGSSFFDELRAAASATNGTERADVTFAPGFNADYALVFNSGFGVSYQLDAFGHHFVNVISGAGFGAGGPYHFSNTLFDLGLEPGDSFRYVLTYLDPVGTFRSNEFHGVAQSTVTTGNIGFDDVTLAAGDFNVLNTGAAGDFNADKIVDGADLLMIQRGLGTTHTAADLPTFKGNFGAVYAAPAVGAVPEPASLAMWSFVLAVTIRRLRGKSCVR